jgi:hypothetical protein
MREKRNVCKLLVGKPEGKRRQGKPINKCVDNTEMVLGERGWGGVDWSGVAQRRNRCKLL